MQFTSVSYRYFLLLLVTLSLSTYISAQDTDSGKSLLEKQLSVNVVDKPTAFLFQTIEAAANLKFSYSPKIFEDTPIVTVIEENKTVRYILVSTFGQNIRFKERGKYIIITDNRQNVSGPFNQKLQVIEGYVTNSSTGEKISNATVYDKNLLIAAITDRYGYFKMEVPYGESSSQIRVQKDGYVDTTIVTPGKNRFITFNLFPTDSIKNKKRVEIHFPKWIVSNFLQTNSRNVNDTLYRKCQLSLFPGVSTNRHLAGNVVNDFSLNIVGYSKGVRKAEVGLIANIVNGNASYFMLGGVNYVQGKMVGVQVSNVFNHAKELRGTQVASAVNRIENSLFGVQIAGAVNLLGKTDTLLTEVPMVSPVENMPTVSKKNSNVRKSVQVAGAVNKALQPITGQIAGGVNIGTEAGTQVGGIYNQADTVKVQIAGFINKAKFVRGVQIGIVNIADTCSGVPIGLFSFIKSGYRQFEASTDELFSTKLAYRTGVAYFHNIVAVGTSLFESKQPLYAIEYGFGTTLNISKKTKMDIDLSSFNLFTNKHSLDEAQLYRFYIGIDRRLCKGLSLCAGLTTNFLSYTNNPDEETSELKEAIPHTLWKKESDDNKIFCGWIGGKIGIRF